MPHKALPGYVLMLVVDLHHQYVIGITKTKGPEFLHGRITFPGGKIEPGESPLAAASRELREETGVQVAAESWVKLDELDTPYGPLHVFCAASDRVLYARTCEEEPVHHLEIGPHLGFARNQPAQYAPDFVPYLSLACELLRAPPVA